MKKLTALFMIISFLTVSAADAFAEPLSSGRNRNETRRFERRNIERRPGINRQDRRWHGQRRNPDARYRDRFGAERRQNIRRPDRIRPGQSPARRPIIRRQDHVRRPVIRHAPRYQRYNDNFWGRAARSHRYHRDRPNSYRRHYNRDYYRGGRDSSVSEFLGISAAMIAIAAIINNMSTDNY